MDRLEAMLAIYGDPASIQMDVAQGRCSACGARIPSMACEAPSCPKLQELAKVSPNEAVARRAEEIRAERRAEGLPV